MGGVATALCWQGGGASGERGGACQEGGDGTSGEVGVVSQVEGMGMADPMEGRGIR